jgi:Spy/CpxP family protein refolding chaperone
MTLTVLAQPPGGMRGNPEEMMKRQLEMLTKELELNEKQQKKVESILKSQASKMRELFEAGPSPEMREEMMAIRQDTDKKMKKELTAEQFEKYEKIQQERMRRGPGGFGGPGGAPPPPQN